MLTGILVFVILGAVFWILSKFLRKISKGLKEAARSETYYKEALLESVQAIKEKVDPTPEPVDLITEIRKVNRELTNKERQRLEDQKAIENLINDTQNIT